MESMVSDQLSQSRKVKAYEFNMTHQCVVQHSIHTNKAVIFTAHKHLEQVNIFTKGNGRWHFS